jgi:hypothetical protein
MDLNARHLDVAYVAYMASHDGCGVVLKDTAYVEADQLAEAGWIDRRFTDTGELAWFWSRQGDAALALSGLLTGQSPN